MAGEARRLAQAVSFIRRELNQDFAIPQLAVFLEVMQKDGITQTEIAERIDMIQGSVSRNVKQLSKYLERQPDGTKELVGYDLLRVEPDLEERRRLACFLTDKGKEVARKLEEIIGGGE